MNLHISTRRISPDIIVVDLAGRLTVGPENDALEAIIRDLVGRNERKIILDIARVDYIDSKGMGSLAYCLTKLRQVNGELRLAGAAGKLQSLFTITRLDSILDFYASVDTAARSFLLAGPSEA